MNFEEAERYVPMIFTTNLRPCFLGHTGIGKTEFWKQFAAKNQMDLIIIHVAQLEPSDFVGLYHVGEDKRTANCPPNWLPYKELSPEQSKIFEIGGENDSGLSLSDLLNKEGFINPNGGIVFLDEVNRAHEDMRQALYQFLQDAKIHTYALPKGDKTKLNKLGLPMGKYHIACAANPSGEGYETYEFDPALTNRLAWVNFMPVWEDTKTYLEGKYGRHPVLSWVDSDKGLIDYGEEFDIKGLLYSPRMTENHILLFNAARKEGKEFKRKVFETIVPKDKLSSFMSYLEEIEYINYKDLMNGVTGEKAKKLAELISVNRMDVISTITNDLADFWANHNLGDETTIFKDEKKAITNTVDFLDAIPDEVCCSFIDGLKKSYDNPKNIIAHKYLLEKLKPKLKVYRKVFS